MKKAPPARKLRKSPMQLSLHYLACAGWTVQIVEHWNSFANIRQDCFGFGDILAYKPLNGAVNTDGVILVQTTSWTNFTHRKEKILASPHYLGWRKAGGGILLQAWGTRGLREEWL